MTVVTLAALSRGGPARASVALAFPDAGRAPPTADRPWLGPAGRRLDGIDAADADDAGAMLRWQGVGASAPPPHSGHQPQAALPFVLGFLVGHGVTLAALEAVADEARRSGATPEAALFASGAMTPEAFYRAFAQELGLPFAAGALSRGALAAEPAGPVGACLRAGVLPVRDGEGARRFALAPEGEALAGLLAARRQLGALGLGERLDQIVGQQVKAGAGQGSLDGLTATLAAGPGSASGEKCDALRAAPAGPGCGLAHALIVTPEALAAAALRASAPLVADAAAHALADVRPDLSCRDGLTAGQMIAILLGVALGVMLAVVAPLALAAVFAVVFLSQATIRLAATFAALSAASPASKALAAVLPSEVMSRPAASAHARCRPGDAPPAKESQRMPQASRDAAGGMAPAGNVAWPIYTVIVPVYGEANMAQHVLQSLARLDYPRAHLDVMIVVEAEDLATRAAFAAADAPPWVRIIVAPDGAPRTKPPALNIALNLARGACLTIYDAEDAPDADQLRKAAAAFAAADPDVACLQARLAIDNMADGWLPACFALEYAALFDAIIPGLARLGFPAALGGTSNHFRTAALRQAMGWDAFNVTEDADLGLRLARLGWRVGDLDSTTMEEAPVSLRPWLKQRTRWMKGWMQVAITHSRAPATLWRELGWLNGWAAFGQCIGIVASALSFPLFSLALGWRLYAMPPLAEAGLEARASLALAATVLAAGALALAAPLIVGARLRGWRLLLAAPLLPAYYLLVSLAAWRALIEQIRHPARWNKTTHGVARSSRSGRLTYTSGTPPQPLPAAASG